MKNLESMGALALGSRLKRLSELLFRQGDEFYRQKGIDFQARCFPLLQLLCSHGSLSVTELAELLGQSHPAISQMSKKLQAQGWLYHEIDAKDERRRLLAVTPQGYELVDEMKPHWQKLKKVLDGILEVSQNDLINNIELMERALASSSLGERVERLEKQVRRDQVEIIHFEPMYGDDFYRLNHHWLSKYFYVEAIDHEVLSNPQEKILAHGGFILLARLSGEIIGTAALIVASDNRLELSKMSVDERFQGFGIGEKLALAAISQYQATDFSLLYLESNRKLLPALNLYQKLGFRERPAPFDNSHYSRADIYMEFIE